MDDEQVRAWVEEISMHLARDGVAPIAGRILGWLMICEPAEQSAAQIADAIGASRASLTMNLRLLTSMGFLTWRSRRGDRTMYYRMADDAWQIVIQRQIAGISAFMDVTRHGLDLVGDGNERGERIRRAHASFAWMAKVFQEAPPFRSEDA